MWRYLILLVFVSFAASGCVGYRRFYSDVPKLSFMGRIVDAWGYNLCNRNSFSPPVFVDIFSAATYNGSDCCRYNIEFAFDDEKKGERLTDSRTRMMRYEGMVQNSHMFLPNPGSYYVETLRHEVNLQIVLVEEYSGKVFSLGSYQTHFLKDYITELYAIVYVGQKEFNTIMSFSDRSVKNELDLYDYSNRNRKEFNVIYSEFLQDSIFYKTCVYVQSDKNAERKKEVCF